MKTIYNFEELELNLDQLKRLTVLTSEMSDHKQMKPVCSLKSSTQVVKSIWLNVHLLQLVVLDCMLATHRSECVSGIDYRFTAITFFLNVVL